MLAFAGVSEDKIKTLITEKPRPETISRGGAEVARWLHEPVVSRSITDPRNQKTMEVNNNESHEETRGGEPVRALSVS